jgi:hypothetical protein
MNTTGNDTVLIRDLRLGTRARNCLRRAEITTAAELVTWTEYELLRDVHGLGRSALAEITDALAKWGWALRKQAPRLISWEACPTCRRDVALRADKRQAATVSDQAEARGARGRYTTRPPGTSPLNLTPHRTPRPRHPPAGALVMPAL